MVEGKELTLRVYIGDVSILDEVMRVDTENVSGVFNRLIVCGWFT